MNNLLNDANLDLVSGGVPINSTLQDGLKYCAMGTPEGGGEGVYGQGTTCSGSFGQFLHDLFKSYGLGHPK